MPAIVASQGFCPFNVCYGIDQKVLQPINLIEFKFQVLSPIQWIVGIIQSGFDKKIIYYLVDRAIRDIL